MLPDWTVVGFTGHRSLADPKAVAGSLALALDRLVATHPSLLAVSSLASGADTLFVREVARRRIPYLLIFPFPETRFRQDFSAEAWQAAAPLREQAGHLEELHETGTDEEAYMEAGVRTVDQADILLAIWDGQPASGLGGTGDVVAYARQLGKPLVWINPLTGAVVTERLDQVQRVAPSPDLSGNPRDAVEQHFRQLDAAASREAPTARHLIQRIVLLHLTATVAGLAALALHIEGPAGYLVALFEVVVLATAFVLTSRHHHTHTEWMQARVEAELCRSVLATWPLRERMGSAPLLASQEFARLIRNLRLAQLLDRTPAPSLESARIEYLEARVRNQAGYFGRQHEKALRSYSSLKRLAMLSTGLAALLAAGHLLLSLAHVEGPAVSAVVLLSLVLPLVSAALLSLILTQEHSRRASRDREMVSLLDEAARRVQAAPTWTSLVRVVTDTEAALLNEVLEWHAFRRFASSPH